jgi:hypothetical protein
MKLKISLVAFAGALALSGAALAQPMAPAQADPAGTILMHRTERLDHAIEHFTRTGRIPVGQGDRLLHDVREVRRVEQTEVHDNGGFLTGPQHEDLTARLNAIHDQLRALNILDSEW